MNLKRSLHLSLLLLSTLATAAAEVPSLINYQGRLVNADGSAQSGQKTFLLEVFDAASGGTLLYREEVGNITLGDGGVYSFQFGGSGTSNAQITETIGTGSEAVLYQQVLSNLPMVAGSVSVSDGTYTWSQENGSSNEDDFSAAFSTNLNRITVNYFSGAPNDGRSINVTYRYQSEGITGALSSGGEHWLQLTIDGDVQATRERVLAVPFALRAGGLVGDEKPKVHRYVDKYFFGGNGPPNNWSTVQQPIDLKHPGAHHSIFPIQFRCRKAVAFTCTFPLYNGSRHWIDVELFQSDLETGDSSSIKTTSVDLGVIDGQGQTTLKTLRFPLDVSLDETKFHYIAVALRTGNIDQSSLYGAISGFPRLTYEE